MADRLIRLMRERVVMIVANGQVGTGSFIAPGYILTCAHVVRKSVDERTDISILYHVYDNERWLPKELNISSENVLLSPQVLDSEYNDVACIKMPLSDHPILLLPNKPQGLIYHSDQEYVAFGYQKKDINTGKNIPQTVSLRYEGEEGGNDELKIIFEDGMIRPGMSGAPLVERETGVITGIIQKTRNPNDDIGAYTIPVETIRSQIKTWQEDGISNLNSLLENKKLQKRIRKEYETIYSPIEKLKENSIPILIFGVLLFGGIFWFFRHFGTIDEAGWLAALLAALPLLGNFLGKQFSKEHSFLSKTLGAIFLKPLSLFIIGAMVLYLWTFKSSVWIYGTRDHAQTAITLFDKSNVEKSYTRKLDKNGEARFLVNSNLFGRKYEIGSDEYEPKSFEIKAFEKKEWLLPDSFILEPVVLLRINTDFLPDLENYYCNIIVGKNDTIKVDSLNKERGSILLGSRRIDVESKFKPVWRETLESSGFNFDRITGYIDGWANYIFIHSNLSYEQRIDLEFYHKELNMPIAKEQYKIDHKEKDIYVSF